MKNVIALLLAALLTLTSPGYAGNLQSAAQYTQVPTAEYRASIRKRKRKMRSSYIHQLEPLQIDCLSTGTTNFELPGITGGLPVVAYLGFRAAVFKSDTNTTVEPVISIGYNDPSYNNLASGITLSSTATQYIDLGPAQMAGDTQIKVNVTTPATADTFSVTIYIFLLYIPV